MVEYRRNPASLKQALREHTISSYPLHVPIFGSAHGISTATIRGQTSVLVTPDKPMSFEEFARAQDWGTTRRGLAEWEQYAIQEGMPHARTEPFRWMHPVSREILEAGNKQSMREIQKTWLEALDELNESDFIVKHSFPIDRVKIDPEKLHPGMLIHFQDIAHPTSREAVGRVLETGVDPEDQQPVFFLEPFEPTPALLAPRSIAPWLLEPSYISDMTWALGFGTLEAMKEAGVRIPKGSFARDDKKHRVYFLDEPMPISKVEQFCNKYYPPKSDDPLDARNCLWQSITFLVIPIHPTRDPFGRHRGGIIQPFPDDLDTTEIEAQMDWFGEATGGFEMEGRR